MKNTPQQKDLFTKRFRTVKAPALSEFRIQSAVWKHFQQRRKPRVLGFHPANGEKRDVRAGAKLKAMGLVPGVSDLVFVWADKNNPWSESERLRILFLELKVPGGPQSDNQKQWEEQVIGVDHDDCNYAIAKGIDEALDIMQGYGIIQ